MNPSSSFHAPTESLPPAGSSKPGNIRAIGWVLAVLGPCISVTMLFTAHNLLSAVAMERLTGRAPRWHGDEAFTLLTAELFWAVILLGGAIFMGGVYQISTGRRSRALIALTLGLAGATAYFAYGVITSR